MACFRPLQAYRLDDGSIVFNLSREDGHPLTLPCGQCVGCRLDRAKQWAIRCIHESQLHDRNCFITLTYDDQHLPYDMSLHYEDFQLFMKRLRKRFSGVPIRFYMAGEYGEQYGRPHFHACIFGLDFDDKYLLKDGKFKLYRSPILESLWPFGHSSIGDVTFQSAGYVARYIMKKQTGKARVEDGVLIDPESTYEFVNYETGEIIRRKPEFNKMSLKPGIGAAWFEKYKSDVYPHDYVVVNGKRSKPPKYYDKLFEKLDLEAFEEVVSDRLLRMLDGDSSERSRDRLSVKEKVCKARIRSLNRSLDGDLTL